MSSHVVSPLKQQATQVGVGSDILQELLSAETANTAAELEFLGHSSVWVFGCSGVSHSSCLWLGIAPRGKELGRATARRRLHRLRLELYVQLWRM